MSKPLCVMDPSETMFSRAELLSRKTGSGITFPHSVATTSESYELPLRIYSVEWNSWVQTSGGFNFMERAHA